MGCILMDGLLHSFIYETLPIWVLRTIIRGLHRCRICSLRSVGPGRDETCLPDFERLYAYAAIASDYWKVVLF